MTSIGQLAADLGVTTADQLPAPPSPPKQGRDRWPPDKKEEFERMGATAVYIAGNEGPEPRYFGDNMGAWPILIGITESWKDTITPNMDRLSPLKERGLLFRVWTESYAEAKRLLALLEGMIRERIDQGAAEKLRGAWLDFGPDTDLALFEFEIHDLAQRKQIAVWDDDALSRLLDARLRTRYERAAGRRQ